MIRFRISGYVFRISEPVVLERVEILSLIEQFQFNFLDDNRWQFILSGLKNTIIITFFAVLLGIFLGFVIAIVRSTHDKTGKLKILNVICRVYLTVIRGTPTVIQLLIMNFVVFGSVSVNEILVGSLAFGINSGAYVAEIVRSGIMSIDRGQLEAGRSLGFSYASTMCIGNLRSGTAALSMYLRDKKKEQLRQAGYYFGVILAFAIGAGIGGVFSMLYGIHVIWISCGLLLVSFLLMSLEKYR